MKLKVQIHSPICDLCRIQTTFVTPRMEAPRWEPHLHSFPAPLPPGFSLPPEVPAPNKTNTEMSPEPPHWGIAKSGISGYNSCRKFQYFFEFFSAQQLKFEVKNHSPICIRFEHVSTTSLSPGIGAVIWQPHLHALSSTSSSSFSMAS